jgi:membrane protein implicated in regulation of membrane protease activity
MFGWFFVVILLLAVSPGLAIALGVLSVAAVAVVFVITTKRRLSSSTTGQKSEFIPPALLGQRPPAFEQTFGEIIQAVDGHRPTRDAATATEPGAGGSRRAHAIIYVVLGILISS